jgi:chromate transporter
LLKNDLTLEYPEVERGKSDPFALFTTFFKIGAFTFGGGYAMLPIIKREVVDDKHWLTEEEFVDVLAVAQSSPGAVAVNSAVFIGTKLRGIVGAFSALLGVIMPSFLIILIIALYFARFTSHPAVVAAFAGVRPAIAALIAAAVVKIGKPVLKERRNMALALMFIALSIGLGLHPIIIIVTGASVGILLHRIAPAKGETS